MNLELWIRPFDFLKVAFSGILFENKAEAAINCIYPFVTCNNSKNYENFDYLKISVLRNEVAYFDCSMKVLSLCLNPSPCRCDPMEAGAQGHSGCLSMI